ncbi:hypothetical protein [Methanoregula sp. UBA64]|jgi:hypothetical protein|uniref:hypothetical protein n=1 Tax=Methanoregula sp. UBA64 TaxID=1915554 RepID=UPI0025E5477C|nr:hypothetical protein [Methanoregula sp. UBA64]
MEKCSIFIETLTTALEAGDLPSVQSVISGVANVKGKQARDSVQCLVNSAIVDFALKNNRPELVSVLRDISPVSVDDLVSRILERYVSTGDKRWFDALDHVSGCVGKKSVRSRITAKIAEFLISAGVVQSEARFISEGLDCLPRISFKKYRSEGIVRSIPLLIPWATAHNDLTRLNRSQGLLTEVTDASKRALCYSDLARAYAAVAINKNDLPLFFDSIRLTAEIPQTLKRREAIRHIISTGMKSGFRRDLLSVPEFLNHFSGLPKEGQNDLIGALIEQFLMVETDKTRISPLLESLCGNYPPATSLVIPGLLSAAERSGDPWYLTLAIQYLKASPKKEDILIRDIIRAGEVVARNVASSKPLLDLILCLEQISPVSNRPGIYLQFLQSLLSLNDYPNAILLFEKVSGPAGNLHVYTLCLQDLIVQGVRHDQKFSRDAALFARVDRSLSSGIISQAISRIVHTLPFSEIITHGESFKQLVACHPRCDSLILEAVTGLVNRGFLDACDSQFLVDLAKSIPDQAISEQALSRIVLTLAEIGVRSGDRDLLQQALGITCLIEGLPIRSAILSSIIDTAASFAAAHGDLDLLLRMRNWSGLLQDQDLAGYAMTNITEGVLKYALVTCDSGALEEAYTLAQDITDPSMRMQLYERIAEAYVRIGCDRIEKPTGEGNILISLDQLLRPFDRGLALLNVGNRKPLDSIKLARMIDILMSSSKKDLNRYYLIPLAQYTLEITNSCERDAMMTRIVAGLGEAIDHPDSSDPYESMAYLLLEHYQKRPGLRVIDLTKRLLDLAQDPFAQLRGFCILADSALRINETVRACQILDETYSAVQYLPAEHQKIQILAGLTVGYSTIDPINAQQCLHDSLAGLPAVGPENDAVARRQIVMAVAGLGEILPLDTAISLVHDIAEKHSRPAEYVRTLILAYPLVQKDKEQCAPFVRTITGAIEKIESPYDQILLLLEIIPISIESCDETIPLYLLKKVEGCSKTLNIPYISDTLHGEVARLLSVLYKKQNNPSYLEKAARQLFQIEDDELRQIRLSQIGYEDSPERSVYLPKIIAFSDKVIKQGCPSGQIPVLERAVRGIPDRSRQALFFCRLSIQFRERGDMKLSKRMLANAINVSGIIRPLSKRAFVRCNLAMKMFAAGYEHPAQEILDSAIDTATTIRESSLRDEVFDELGLAIQIMQGMRE